MSMRVLSLCAVVTLSACAPDPSYAPDDTVTSDIIGGTSDTADPSVVALYAQTRSSGALCTASVISPTVLLTAAHCVAPSEVGAGATFTALTGSDLQTSQGEHLAVRATHFDPRFDPTRVQDGHDVGIVVLEKPTTLSPLPFNRSGDVASLVGAKVRVVGYGVDDGSAQTGAGVKRFASLAVDSVDDKLIRIGGDGRDTCQGDSGGPAFAMMNGEKTIVGVTSFGQAGCGQGGYDTRVDLYSAFIDQYLSPGSSPSHQPAAATGSETEPNDEASAANEIGAGVTKAHLGTTGDVDWFTFTAPGPSTYTVTMAAARASSSFRVYKLTGTGTMSSLGLATDAHDGSDRSFERSTSAGGIYYVKVFDDGEAHVDRGAYTLTLTLE